MPDPHRIKRELEVCLSDTRFSLIFTHRNRFRKPDSPLYTAASVAKDAADYVWKNNLLLDPVEVVTLNGPVQLYRAHGGGSKPRTAGTLGPCWVERSVAETIWKATARYDGNERFDMYMEFLRTSNFVLPEWNRMLQIACMSVPHGNMVVVVRGKGSWKAMRTAAGTSRPAGAGSIRAVGDVITNAGMMPTPGGVQCFIPLYNEIWIHPVPYPSARWPFLT